MEVRVTPGGCAELDELGDLWRAMLEHHRRVAGSHFPVRDPDGSWARTRADYERWLLDGDAMLLIARDVRSWRPVGYVLYLLTESGGTFDLGPLRGDVHSLVVSDEARGAGIGTELLEAVRSDLRDRGIDYWSVGVLADNVEAERLYRRLGFSAVEPLAVGFDPRRRDWAR
jgi:ribosomal protein S18 acetylase RimI-like enzyme